jgi:hypothetical protein
MPPPGLGRAIIGQRALHHQPPIAVHAAAFNALFYMMHNCYDGIGGEIDAAADIDALRRALEMVKR